MVADTQTFLSLFTGRQTFQTFDDKAKDRTLSSIIHDYEPAQLQKLNDQGAGVYMMINEGDGQGRKNANVTRIRAYFADFDGTPLPESWPLEPQVIVESSPGKYHAYWMLSDAPALDNAAFNAQQEAIAIAVGAKPNDAKGLARVMRVPGFDHHKTSTPFTTRVVKANTDAWCAADIAQAYPAAKPEPKPKVIIQPTAEPSDTLSMHKIYEVIMRNHSLDEGRNNLGFLLACQIRDNGFSEADCTAFMLNEYHADMNAVGDEFTQDEVRHAVKQAYTQPARQPWPELETPSAATLVKTKGASGSKPAEVNKLTANDYRDIVLDHWATNGVYVKYISSWQEAYVYEHGVYKNADDALLTKRIESILEAQGVSPSESKLKDALAKLKRHDTVFMRQPPYEGSIINVKNGLLDIDTLRLQPHTPDVMTFVQLPAVFDANAVCPAYQEFIRKVLPSQPLRDTLHEFFGYCLTPYTYLQKSLMLIGIGGSGKGTLVSTIMALMGGLEPHGMAGQMDIESLIDNHAGLVNALNKRMLYISEIAQSKPNLVGFKKVVGEDPVLVNPKYKKPYNVILKAKIVISANTRLHTGDDSANNSIDRRLIQIPFNYKQTYQDYDPLLKEKLTTPEELSGILLLVCLAWQRLKQRGYRFTTEGDKAERIEFLARSNPVIHFVREQCEAANEFTAASDLYEAWAVYCEGEEVPAGLGTRRRTRGHGYYIGSHQKFIEKFTSACEVLEIPVENTRERTGSGNPKRGYRGVVLT